MDPAAKTSNSTAVASIHEYSLMKATSIDFVQRKFEGTDALIGRMAILVALHM